MNDDNDHISTDNRQGLLFKIKNHLRHLYPIAELDHIATELIDVMGLSNDTPAPHPHQNIWDQSDVYLITYADSIIDPQQVPLATLHQFLNTHLQSAISAVHILPFYPYSSDDGFAVIDYYQVNHSFGEWPHIQALAKDYKLMADVVINHCSARSGWFENFKAGKHPGKDYFFHVGEHTDTSEVVRPRTHPLLKEVSTVDGLRYVWCTFSHDQVDFDFRNPKVLIEFASILKFYLDKGISIFRFDAVAFLWKQSGTSCINLVETHEAVKLLRLLVEHYRQDAIIITETNVPNRENLMYFGNANEAHAVYNFSLPPLLVNTLITGNCAHLKTWLMSLPPAQNGTTYFNFIASHDGIGLRPVEGLLSQQEIDQMINTMINFGGRISWRALKDGKNQPYEINIALFDALSGTINGQDALQIARFICAHAIMLAIEGIPAIYIHSLVATNNDHEKVRLSSQNRAINRHKWDNQQLSGLLQNPYSQHAQVLTQLKKLIAVRKKQPAFHPNATQYTLHLGVHLFAFWRQSPDRKQSIFSINNVTDKPQPLSLSDLNLIELDSWIDLISNTKFIDVHQQITLEPYQTIWLSNIT